ncbi:MAG: YbaK/EbsC family protein [Halocynthiibacter sp.]
MSKSLKRVRNALLAHGLSDTILEMDEETRTAQQAAQAAGCEIDQIAKSILFWDTKNDAPVMFLTAGGNQVDAKKAAQIVGHALSRADAKRVRAVTGFAIGGVSPIGHLTPCPIYMDPRLLDFPSVWAAAGTPRHIFSVAPTVLHSMTQATIAAFTA